MFVTTHSKNGRRLFIHSLSHTPIEIAGQTGAGIAEAAHTQPDSSVRGAICSFKTVYNPRHQTLVSMPIDLIDRKWTFKGFAFLFSSRPHASTLHSSWSAAPLVWAIKWQISPPASHTFSSTACPRWPVEISVNVCGRHNVKTTNIDNDYARRHYHAPRLLDFVPVWLVLFLYIVIIAVCSCASNDQRQQYGSQLDISRLENSAR